jgi:hypothetical protein
MSLKLMPISSMPVLEKISIIGVERSWISTSTGRWSSLPSFNIRRSFSRVADADVACREAPASESGDAAWGCWL